MNYKKSLLVTAIALGAGLISNAQSANFSLNGLGRSVLTSNKLSGPLVDTDNTIQKAGVSGYNLFDLQTNLAVDSNFQAMAIFRTTSPFGSFFGATTAFEFRQFKISGNLENFKYEIGDIRVEMTPYTVFNNYTTDLGYESKIFTQRRSIQEYENFNEGNSWLLQGAAGQYSWNISDKGMGLGIYAFTTRNTSTNEVTVPDRLLSGGRVQFNLNKDIKIGVNAVTMYDISLLTSDFDYNNNVFTADFGFKKETDSYILDLNIEGGVSNYAFSQFVDQDTIIGQTDTTYEDGFVELNASFVLKKSKLRFDLNARTVGVLFSSPSAQTRRIHADQTPRLLGVVPGGDRAQLLYDRSTAEEIYNSTITPTLMAFLPYYNNATPYGNATPNRTGGSIKVSSDSSYKNLEAGLKLTYLMENQGEGGPSKRTFMVVSGGTNVHVGKLLKSKRMIDVNVGLRYEATKRSDLSAVDLTSMLIDAGFSIEVLDKIDILAGAKLLSAKGNEYIANRDGFGLISSFTPVTLDINETILSFGARVRFSTSQYFTVNYNLVNSADNLATTSNYDFGQLFVNYTGKF